MSTPDPARRMDDYRARYRAASQPVDQDPRPGQAVPNPAPGYGVRESTYRPVPETGAERTGPNERVPTYVGTPLDDVADFETVETTSTKKDVSGRGLSGWMNRTFGMSIAKSEAETITDRQVGTINSTVRYPQVIGLVGTKGGVGKTSVLQVLGQTIARHRSSGGVVGIDADRNSTLADRMAPNTPNPQTSSIKRLAHDHGLSKASDVNAHLIVSEDGFAVLPGVEVTRDKEINDAELLASLDALSLTNTIMLLDFPGSSEVPVAQTALECIDSLVYVVELTSDSIKRAKRNLREIAETRPDLLAHATIILNHRTPFKVHVADLDRHVTDIRSLARGGEGTGMHVYETHFDPHVGEGGHIKIGMAEKSTQDRFLEIAADIIDRLPKDQPRYAFYQQR